MDYIEVATLMRKTIHDIRAAEADMSIPANSNLLELGYEPIIPDDMPPIGPGESLKSGPLVRVESRNIWREPWEVVPADTLKLIDGKVDALWRAADNYTSSFISGVAVGILTLGVLAGKPKCLAVAAWSGSIWVEYYARKSQITSTSLDDHDFSSYGPIPYTIPELQVEVGM